MQNEFSLDVMLLTYNRAEFFRKSLISICEQTYQDFTIKIFNNGSTDNTKQICEEIISNYPQRKFKYMELHENHQDDYFIQKKNDFITAKYVMVFHDDDLMHPNYLEHAMDIIKKHPDVVILGGKTKISKQPERLIWDTPNRKYQLWSTRDFIRNYMIGDIFAFPAIIYRSELYKTTRFKHDLYGNRGDVPFLVDISKYGKICLLETRFLHYRIHEHQTANTLPTMKQRINLINLFQSILLLNNIEDKIAFKNRINVYIKNNYITAFAAFKNGWISFYQFIKVLFKTKRYFFCYYFFRLLKHLFSGELRSKIKNRSIKYHNKLSFIPKSNYNEQEGIPVIRNTKNIIFKFNLMKKQNNMIEINRIKPIYQNTFTINIIGRNNDIYIENIHTNGDIFINIFGNNNKIIIRNEVISKSFHIDIIKSKNCKIEIQKGYIENFLIKQSHDNSNIFIKKFHKILYGVVVSNFLNTITEKNMTIGENVILREGVKILNNSSISNNSDIPPNSVILKSI